MTREEAIEKVRAMNLSPGKDAELIIALHTLIPELRESEDERIRKGLVNFLQSPFIKENLTDEKVAPWVAYLEKQKEASKAIEAVDRIDKYIDDHLANAHDMKDSNPDKKYYRGWDDALGKMAGILQDVYSEKENKFAPRVLPCSAAWFEDGEEKQKEHRDYRKLYEDIAKSEWFKKAYVGKSLGGDDEQKDQKPNFDTHWENGSMVYEQKEQKPTTIEKLRSISTPAEENWLEIQKKWEKEDEQKFAEWKPQPESLEALMYAIEGKWEMIKPTSYLSRRLEDLYEGLVNTYNVDETFLAELPKTAYSAKDIEELRALKDKIEASMDEKPTEWVLPEDFEEAVYKVANFISPFDSQAELRRVSHRFAEQLLSLAKKELDKPVEWDDYTKTNLDRAIRIIKDAIGNLYGYQTDDGIYECDKAIEALEHFLYLGLEIEKPAEWSDEDNIGWDEAFACVTRAEKAAKNEEELQNAVTAEKWLKEIKFNYCVHPVKREWSKEDEMILERFLGWLQGTMGEKTYSSWLKSVRERFNLQLKQEWSEEDENCLSTVIWCFEKFAEGRATVCIQPGDAKAYLKVIKNWKPDNLKSLRPQPHWEPSGSRISEFKMKLNEFAEAYNLAATDCESDEYKSCDGNLQILINKYFAELLDLARTELFKHDLAIKFMSYLDENRPEGKMCLSNSECEEIEKAFLVGDWEKIKGYFHKYQWKPSEEQMEALRVTIDFMPDTFKPRCTLITLQNCLEKLI